MTAFPARADPLRTECMAWLARMEQLEGRPLTLEGGSRTNAGDDEARLGVDAVWLMGVWERSPAGRTLALSNRVSWRDGKGFCPAFSHRTWLDLPYCIRRVTSPTRAWAVRKDSRLPAAPWPAAAFAWCSICPKPHARRCPPVGSWIIPNTVSSAMSGTCCATLRPSSGLRAGCLPGAGPLLPALARCGSAQHLFPRVFGRPQERFFRTSPTSATACAATWPCGFERCLCRHLGKPGRNATGGGLLARSASKPGPPISCGFSFYRRGCTGA